MVMVLVFKTNTFAVSYKDSIINKIVEIKLYEKYEWNALLHIHNGKSDIKDSKFWLSDFKKINSKNELIATVEAFFKNDDLSDNHAICKFPARFNFLVNELNLDKNIFPKVYCNEFNTYLSKVPTNKISISFASENILSPMSMMGHMFIKLSGVDGNERNVENAISYYANYDVNKSAFKFYFNSLFYGSYGIYNITPYRNKLIEYNDDGNRNIWDYELSLNQNQINTLIYHIWELKGVDVPYNFITHNCGTATTNILAVTDERFTKVSKKFWSTPLDVLKRMYGVGLISRMYLYPSDNYKISMFQDNFNNKELKLITNFIKTENYTLIENKEKNNLLFMSDMIVGNLYVNKKIDSDKYKRVQKIIYDNFDGMSSVNLKQETKIQLNSPFSSSFGTSFERYKNHNGLGLTFYPVYRDINDDSSQYFNDFSLKLLNLETFIDSDNKVYIKNLDLLNIKSLIPSTYLLPALSFNLKTGYKNYYSYNDNNGNFIIEGGIGKTYSFNNFINPYLIIDGGFFQKPYLKLDTGIILKMTRKNKIILSYNYYIENNKNLNYVLDLSENFYLNDRFAINLKYSYNNFKKIDSYNNFSLGIKFYF